MRQVYHGYVLVGYRSLGSEIYGSESSNSQLLRLVTEYKLVDLGMPQRPEEM